VVVEAAVKKGTKKTTLWSEWGSTLKKCLTEPTLLEISEYATNQELSLVLPTWLGSRLPLHNTQRDA
jgi:hypothetical protein